MKILRNDQLRWSARDEKRGKFSKLISEPIKYGIASTYKSLDRHRENRKSEWVSKRERDRETEKGRKLKIKWKVNTFVQSIISDGAKMKKLLIKVASTPQTKTKKKSESRIGVKSVLFQDSWGEPRNCWR